MDSYKDVFLLLSSIAQHRFHSVSQTTVVLYTNRKRSDDNTNNHCPPQENKEKAESDGKFEKIGEQKPVADGDKEYQPKYDACIMPNAPRLDTQK